MILLETEGVRYQGFTSASVSKSLDGISSQFEFSATNEEIANFPIKNLENTKIFIDDKLVLTGFIDIIEPSYDNKGHSINISGRSKTSLLVDSSVWDKKTFKAPVNFVTIAEKIISDLGANIKVINNFGTINNYTKDISAESGESAFSFLERLARKSQILLTDNPDGNLVLTRSSNDSILTILLHQKNNIENNVLSASNIFDFTRRYSKYKILGQASADDFSSNEIQTNNSGFSEDIDALQGKRLIILADQEIDIKTANDYAKWESNIRRINSQIYKVRVQGHSHLEDVWDINIITKVFDEYADIKSQMLVKKVVYTESGSGTFTDMVLVSPDAYTLKIKRSSFEKQTNKIGNGLDF